jgi:thiol-disulfide isomerase/thioredoxin
MIRYGRFARPTILMLLISVLHAPFVAKAQDAFPWEEDLVAAWQKALKQDQPLVVYFFSSTCPHCQKLEAEVLSSREFGTLAQQAVYVRVDMAKELSESAKRMSDSLSVTHIPAIYVLDARADVINEIDRIVGFTPPEEFFPRFSELRDQWRKAHAEVPKETALEQPSKEAPPAEEAATPTAPTGACSVTNEALAVALNKLQLNPQRINLPDGGCIFRVSLQQQDQTYSINVANVPKRGVWIGVPLVKFDAQRADAPALVKLLEANYVIFPAQFAYSSHDQWLYVNKAVDEREVLDADRLKEVINEVVATAHDRQNLWSDLGTR